MFIVDIREKLRSTYASWANSHETPENAEVLLEAVIEIERLRKLVKDAYNRGFIEGGKEYTSNKGGIPWSDCKFRGLIGEKND